MPARHSALDRPGALDHAPAGPQIHSDWRTRVTTDFIGADHEFHSEEFATGWAERFLPTPERIRLFELVFSQLDRCIPPNGTVVELGIGPGYLADYLLERLPGITYYGIDFSSPMLQIARKRLQSYSSQVRFIQSDLVEEHWSERVSTPVHAFVSTWALHDLGSPTHVNAVYEGVFHALNDDGILVNGDFIKPVGAVQEFEGGRFSVDKHLELLRQAGFAHASCLSVFEEELRNPTAAQNYACILAEK